MIKYYEDRYNNEYQELQDTFREITNKDHIYYKWYAIEYDMWDKIERIYFIEWCWKNWFEFVF